MTKNIIAIAITAGIMYFAASSGLRAGDQKTAASVTSGQGGQCNDCHDGDAPPTPTPAPSPAK